MTLPREEYICIMGWNPTQGETLVVLGATPIAQCVYT